MKKSVLNQSKPQNGSFIHLILLAILIYLFMNGLHLIINAGFLNSISALFIKINPVTPYEYIIEYSKVLMLSSLLITIGFPRLWISSLVGAILGVNIGTIITLIASLIGSTLLFLLGKKFVNTFVQKYFKSGLYKVKKRITKKNAFWWVLYCRLFPLSNSTLISLFLGSINVSFLDFFLGSLLGFIPLSYAFAIIGNSSLNDNYGKIYISFILIILVVISQRLFSREKSTTHRSPKVSVGS